MLEPFVSAHAEHGAELLVLRSWTDKLDGLTAGITARGGGVSAQPWATLNCALHVGDRDEDVIENRRRVSEALHFALEDWTSAEQTHGCRIQVVQAADRGRGSMSRTTAFADTDGLVTDVRGVLLTTCYADCVPLYVVDPKQGAIGIAHAGWKGTAQQIAIKIVQIMEQTYGSKAEDMFAAIGPSIGACCYEVDDRVVEAIGLPAPMRQENGRYMLDLKEANRQFMIRAGIKPNNIERSAYCTSCRTDLFFSHRAEEGRTGRMAAWIGWKKR